MYEPLSQLTMETFNLLLKQILQFAPEESAKMKQFIPVKLANVLPEPTLIQRKVHTFILYDLSPENPNFELSIKSIFFPHFPSGKGYLVSPTETINLVYSKLFDRNMAPFDETSEHIEFTNFIVEKLNNGYMFVGHTEDKFSPYFQVVTKIKDGQYSLVLIKPVYLA